MEAGHKSYREREQGGLKQNPRGNSVIENINKYSDSKSIVDEKVGYNLFTKQEQKILYQMYMANHIRI